MSRLPLHPPLARPPGPPRPRAVAFDPGPAIGRVDVSILKRSALSVAPETVFFRARITAPGLSEAADRGRYDESFHKPLYVWDFGDPGAVSDKVVNLRPPITTSTAPMARRSPMSSQGPAATACAAPPTLPTAR
jgi:hypothetical protein